MRYIPILLLLAAAVFFAATYYAPSEQKPGEAKLIGYSLFEKTPWYPGYGIRMIYEIPMDQVPSEAEYVWINVTIPDSVIQKLKQILNELGVKDLEKDSVYPVYFWLGKYKTSQELQLDSDQSYFSYQVLETDEEIPKKLAVRIKNKGIGWKYLVVYAPVPFFEGWNDNKVFEGDRRVCMPEVRKWDDGWEEFYIEPGDYVCVVRYVDGLTDKYRVLRMGEAEGKLSIIARNVDIKIDPTKPLYLYYQIRTGGGWEWYYWFGIILSVLDNRGNTKNILLVQGNNNWGMDYNGFINKLQSTLSMTFDCTVWIGKEFRDDSWQTITRKVDLRQVIEEYCPGLSFNNLTKITKIYLAAIRDDSDAWTHIWSAPIYVSYIAIPDPRIYKG